MNKNQNTFPDVCSLLVRPTMFQIAFCSELNPSLSILQILILVSLNRFRPPRFLQCVGLDKTHRGLLPQQYQQITSSIIKNHQTSKKSKKNIIKNHSVFHSFFLLHPHVFLFQRLHPPIRTAARCASFPAPFRRARARQGVPSAGQSCFS